MIDIRVTQLEDGNLDILLEDGKTVWADDGVQVAQHCAQRLMKIQGESVTGNANEEGTKMYEIIFDASKSRAEKELHLKKRIMGTPGVKKIVKFNWEQTGRDVVIDDTFIDTDFGTVQLPATTVPL